MYWGKIPAYEIKERQGRKLHQFLSRKVYPYSPYYRKLFDQHQLKPDRFRRLEDLRHIPFTTKADIAPTADNPGRWRDIILEPTPQQIRGDLTITERIALFAKSRLYLRTIADQVLDEYLPVLPTFTTGRSALPTAFVYTRRDLDILRKTGKRLFQVVGLERRHDRGLHAFPFAPHLAFWQVAMACYEVGLLCHHSGGGRVMGSKTILRLGEHSHPTFIIGTPGYLMHLAHLAEEEGIRLTHIRKVILGGERVSREYKAKLREQLGKIGSPDVQIHATYGFTEAKKAWMESADTDDSRFLTYPDFEIFEVVDPQTGEPVAEGEPGEIVYTYIAGAGSAVLRYRTGDMVAEGLVYDRCPHTGLILPLLGTTITRVSEIKKVKDTLVDFNELFGFFNSLEELVDWQLVLTKPAGQEHGRDVIRLRAALAEGVDQERFKSQLREEFKALLEVGLDEVEWLERQALATELGMETLSKEARIVDQR